MESLNPFVTIGIELAIAFDDMRLARPLGVTHSAMLSCACGL